MPAQGRNWRTRERNAEKPGARSAKQARVNNRRREKVQADQIVELGREAGRVYYNTPSIYRTPLELARSGELKPGHCLARMASILEKHDPLSKPHAKGPSPDQKLGAIGRHYVVGKMISKTIDTLSVAAFREARPHLIEGINQCFDRFVEVKGIKALDLMFLQKLTEVTLERKFDHKYLFSVNEYPDSQSITYRVTGAYLNNSKMPSGEYQERPMGGEYVFSASALLKDHVKPIRDEVFLGNPDFPRDFATRSVLFPLNKQDPFVTDFLLGELNHALAGEGGVLENDNYVELAGEILNTVNNISKMNTDTIQYTDPVTSTFYTSDYQVIFCQNKGEKEFKTQFHDYNILIHRKMAFALLKITANKSKPHMIPLFEEAMIYLQKKENSVLKNTARCLVLSSKPRGKDFLHVFGDNAFTCTFPSEIRSSSDRHQTSMKNAGIVVGLLDKVRHLRNGLLDEQPLLRGMFGFLVGQDRDKTKAYLTRIVENQRKYAIDNASDALKAEIRERHSIVINDDDLLSRSFLANQLKSKAITDEQNQNIRVQLWIASATFSVIAIQIKGKNMTYGFLQTYPFEEEINGHRRVVDNPPDRRVDDVSRSEKRGRPADTSSEPANRQRPRSAKPTGLYDAKPTGLDDAKPTDLDDAKPIDLDDVVLDRRQDSVPMNDVPGNQSQSGPQAGGKKSAFPDSKSGGLPLELELELELL
jgi:hypothetical protein